MYKIIVQQLRVMYQTNLEGNLALQTLKNMFHIRIIMSRRKI